MKEDAGIADAFAAEEKENLKLVKAYRKKESDLNSNISKFLVSRYGHSAEAPPIGDKKDLIMQQNLNKKQREDASKKKEESKKRKEINVGADGKKILSKNEIQMSIEDMKYMSAGQQMKRFVHYLNHAFYADADSFLKEKHSAFLRKMHPKKKS